MYWDSLSPSWQQTFEQAWEAYGAGSLPIGSVVTDQSGVIIAVGRNRLYEETAEPGLLAGNHLAHAEINALAAIKGDAFDTTDLVVYSTMEPCPMCTGAIRMNGVGAVHFAARDPMAGNISLLDANEFMRRPSIRVSGPPSPEYEIVSVVLNLTAFYDINPDRDQANRMANAWKPVVPEAVRIAAEFH